MLFKNQHIAQQKKSYSLFKFRTATYPIPEMYLDNLFQRNPWKLTKRADVDKYLRNASEPELISEYRNFTMVGYQWKNKNFRNQLVHFLCVKLNIILTLNFSVM